MARCFWKGFPSRLRVGAHDIKVRVVTSRTLGGPQVHGEYNSMKQLFRFSEAAPSKTSAADTALHEICHALLEPLGLAPEEDERVCYVLGGGLVQVLRSNPQLLEWLSEAIKEEETNGSTNGRHRPRK